MISAFWSCPACTVAVDGDLTSCPKCGAPRPSVCRVPDCDRKPRHEFAYCDRHVSELLTRAMAS